MVKKKVARDVLSGVTAVFLAVLWSVNCKENILAVFTVLCFFNILALTAVEDMESCRIRDEYCVLIIVLAIVSVFTMRNIEIGERIIGLVSVSAPMLTLTVLIPGSFGGGDIKLMFACGGFLGWRLNIVAAVVSVFLAGGYGLWFLIIKRRDRKEHFPLGPFLCAGMVISLFVGPELWKWFLQV